MRSILIFFFVVASFIARGQKTVAEQLGYPKDAKLLILHDDDLGVSHSENMASIAAMEKGCVNSASIMAACPWFPEIAAYAKSHPSADFGLHITLTSEWKYYKWGALTSREKAPGLFNSKGYLYSTSDSVRMNAKASEVEEETRNQVKRALAFGMDPTHLDAHMYVAFSDLEFLKAYLKVGHEFRLPVLVPRQQEVSLKINLKDILSTKDVIVDNILTAHPADFKSGIHSFYVNTLKSVKPGLNMFIIHTAYDNDEMQAVTVDNINWGSAWRQEEFNFFTSQECSQLIKENNIYVVTWREIRDKIVRKQ